LDVSKLPKELQDVLRAFGAERRVVERYVLRDANLRIEPGEVVAVVGASGAGKTTLLRLLIGAIRGVEDENYRPSEGVIKVPKNAKVEYLLPGEHEPEFGDETILEHISHKTGDAAVAVEILNAVGLSDAIFYRARITELSTGQKERAKLASLIASKPNLLVVDEFAAHLDPQTAQRVARKLSQLCRKAGITLVVATNRLEVLRALYPDKVVIVGYGTVVVKSFDEYIASLEGAKV
ncbi:MAG TPA: ATP-binding cassette domain-containing protein, partial [Pyrodictiaceae archaeon]|nr:ATP-binding cassette domain-containing protein [Pyrodictiaceae archaeon]